MSDEERLVRARDQTRRQLIVVSVVLLVVLVGGTALAGLVLSDHPTSRATSFWFLLGVPLALTLAGLGVALWVFWHRSIRLGGGWVLLAAEPLRSRRVLTELSRGGDIADEDREFARVHAARQARAGWIPWVSVIAGVMLLIGAVADRQGVLWPLGLVFGLVVVLSALWQRRTRGRLLDNALRQGLLPGVER